MCSKCFSQAHEAVCLYLFEPSDTVVDIIGNVLFACHRVYITPSYKTLETVTGEVVVTVLQVTNGLYLYWEAKIGIL